MMEGHKGTHQLWTRILKITFLPSYMIILKPESSVWLKFVNQLLNVIKAEAIVSLLMYYVILTIDSHIEQESAVSIIYSE